MADGGPLGGPARGDLRLREQLTDEILAAIRQHVESLPPEKRAKPTRPVQPQKLGDGPVDRPGNALANGKPARILPPAVPIRTKTTQDASTKPVAEKPKLAPPTRLLANSPRRLP